VMLAIGLDTAGDLNGGIREAREAQKLAPDNPRIGLTLAEMRDRAGERQAALRIVERARANPAVRESPEAAFLMARLLRSRPEARPEAIRLLQETLAKVPGHVPASALLGRLLLESGRSREARAHLETAARGGEPSGEALEDLSRALRLLGLPGEARRRGEEAARSVRFFRELRRARRRCLTYPGDIENAVRLAEMEAARGDRSDALDLLKAALRRDPDHRRGTALLARLLRAAAAPGERGSAQRGSGGPRRAP